jgi:hypothetical protein
MHVYVFASTTLTNIWAGVGAHLWAISDDQANMAGTAAKAAKLPVGAFGILYCSAEGSRLMTTPFVVTSRPHPQEVVSGVWGGEWRFPFSITPLGSPRRFIDTAELAQLPSAIIRGQRWNNILPVQGQFVFQPSDITEDDWEFLYSRLHG